KVSAILQAWSTGAVTVTDGERAQPRGAHSSIATPFFHIHQNAGVDNPHALLKGPIDALNCTDELEKARPVQDEHDQQANDVIAGASPNWSMNGMPEGGGFGGGSPDGDPTPAPTATPNVTGDTTGGGQTVYVLDTAPLLGASKAHSNETTGTSTPLRTVYCL